MFSSFLAFHNTALKIQSESRKILETINNNLKPYLTSRNSFQKSVRISIERARKVIDIPGDYKKLAYYHNVQLFQSRDKRKYFVTDGFSSADIEPLKGIAKVFYYPAIEKDSFLFTPLFFTIVLIELLRYQGLYYLHSGAVSKDRKNCILIAGEGNTGKTTLTTLFIKSGYYFLGDDAIFIYKTDSGINAYSYARDFLFTRDGIKYFPDLLHYISTDNGTIKLPLPAGRIFKDKLIKESRPEVILFTSISGQKRTVLKEMPQRDALKNLILCSQQVMFDNIVARSHLETLKKLVVQCRNFSAELGRDLIVKPRQTIEKLEEQICQYQK
jgi:hypothetical protein